MAALQFRMTTIARPVNWTILLAICFGFTCCRKAPVPAQHLPAEVVEVALGQACGWCTTPSSSELRINELEITETRVLYTPQPEPQGKLTWKTNKSAWRDLQRSIDEHVVAEFGTKAGCPGCSDERVEWVEIKFGDGSKRAITYNAGGAPPPIAALVQKIRAASINESGVSPAPRVLRLSPDVASRILVHRVDPVYPPEARRNHIQGDVLLRATIGKDGRLHDVKVISGRPELVGAVLAAVEQWRYQPYKLNGEPVEVQTTLSIRLHM